MFALRRPNVLPVGDLGIQRGMVLFYLSDAPSLDASGKLLEGGVSISARKKKSDAAKEEVKEEEEEELGPATQAAKEAEEVAEKAAEVGEELLTGSQMQRNGNEHEKHPTGPSTDSKEEIGDRDLINGLAVARPELQKDGKAVLPSVPADSGVTLATLRSRREGKKIKGAYLTPEEMRSLAKSWEPYRSIASFFMYTLIDGVPSK
jgi:DNA-3-methyladenine glycosylase II